MKKHKALIVTESVCMVLTLTVYLFIFIINKHYQIINLTESIVIGTSVAITMFFLSGGFIAKNIQLIKKVDEDVKEKFKLKVLTIVYIIYIIFVLTMLLVS